MARAEGADSDRIEKLQRIAKGLSERKFMRSEGRGWVLLSRGLNEPLVLSFARIFR